jgi:small subunit ribosomal protein S6
MKDYELTVLIHPDLESDLEKALDKVRKLVTANGGEVVKEDNWGKKKLAYPIKKHDSAVYVFYTVEMPGESVRKVEYTFNITDEVIRFLFVRPDFKAIAKADAEKARKAEQAAKRGDREDNEEDEE